MGQFPLEQWFYEMPVCTRWWTAATVATSLLVQCHIITPFQLFYSFRAVFVKNQVRSTLRTVLGTLTVDFKILTLSPLVLAFNHYLRLLRSLIPRSPLPRLLPPAVFPASRRIIRTISCTLFMAVALRHFSTPLLVSDVVDALLGFCPQQQLGLHLVAKKSRDQVELPRPTGLYRAILAMGLDGL